MMIEGQGDCSIDLADLNAMPINQKAGEMLVSIGIKPNRTSLYCIQLAKWGYEKGGIEVEDAVSETIEAMFAWRPVRIANFFTIKNKSEEYSPVGWKEANRPLTLAGVILDDIEEKMLLHFPWYKSM